MASSVLLGSALWLNCLFFPLLLALSWDGWVAASDEGQDKRAAAVVALILGTLVWLWGAVGPLLWWTDQRDMSLDPFSAMVETVGGLVLTGGGLLYLIPEQYTERFQRRGSKPDRELELDEET